MNHTRVVSTKYTPGFVCRAFSDTTLVCFIVNEHTTKCSHYMHNRRNDKFVFLHDALHQSSRGGHWSQDVKDNLKIKNLVNI